MKVTLHIQHQVQVIKVEGLQDQRSQVQANPAGRRNPTHQQAVTPIKHLKEYKSLTFKTNDSR